MRFFPPVVAMPVLEVRSDYLPFGKPNFSEEEIAAVTRVMRTGWVGTGAETQVFESELGEFVGAEHVVAVNSCTSALFLALRALGVGPGDEVVVPSLTWCSTANAAIYLGATPVFCDVDLVTMSASPATVAAAVTVNTKAVIQVHYGGLAADMAALRAVLPPKVSIVEDAAHALGACYPDGNPVGSAGNLTCFSFYANKNLSTGDGGAIASRDGELAGQLRLASNQGLQADAWKRFSQPLAAFTPEIADIGYKMNFTDLQAAIGRVQLRRQDEFRARRQELAARYLMRLGGSGVALSFQDGLVAPGHARHLFVVRVPVDELALDRNELLLELRGRNVGASIHYAPLHMLPVYRPYVRVPLPNTERLGREIMTLPIGASVNLADVDYVAAQLLDLVEIARNR